MNLQHTFRYISLSTLRDYDVNCPHRDVFYWILTRDQEFVFSLAGVQKLRIRRISMFAYIQQIELRGTIAGTFDSKIFEVQIDSDSLPSSHVYDIEWYSFPQPLDVFAQTTILYFE